MISFHDQVNWKPDFHFWSVGSLLSIFFCGTWEIKKKNYPILKRLPAWEMSDIYLPRKNLCIFLVAFTLTRCHCRSSRSAYMWGASGSKFGYAWSDCEYRWSFEDEKCGKRVIEEWLRFHKSPRRPLAKNPTQKRFSWKVKDDRPRSLPAGREGRESRNLRMNSFRKRV